MMHSIRAHPLLTLASAIYRGLAPRRHEGLAVAAACAWTFAGAAGAMGTEGSVSPILRAHLVAEQSTRLEIEIGTFEGAAGSIVTQTWDVLVVETRRVEEGEQTHAVALLEELRGARVLQRMEARPGQVLVTSLPPEVFGAVERIGVLVRARGAGLDLTSQGQAGLGWTSIALPPLDPAEPLVVPPAYGAVLVTEFMKDPAAVSDTRGEWVEFQNRTDAGIDLEGWTLRDDGSNRTVITASAAGAGVVVPAGGFVVLGRHADPALNGGVLMDATYTGFTLGNGADQIVLEAPGGHEVDRVEYEDGTANWPDASGASISLSPRFAGTSVASDGAAWCSGVDVMPAGDLGSPGEQNPACQ